LSRPASNCGPELRVEGRRCIAPGLTQEQITHGIADELAGQARPRRQPRGALGEAVQPAQRLAIAEERVDCAADRGVVGRNRVAV
jgi:hypothetical protein